MKLAELGEEFSSAAQFSTQLAQKLPKSYSRGRVEIFDRVL